MAADLEQVIPARLFSRFRKRTQAPELLDELGHEARTRQMVWIMSLGRFLALAEIPLMAWFSPEWIGSMRGAALVFAAGLLYTVFYVSIAIRTRAVGGPQLHVLDITAGVILLLLAARTSNLLFPMAFYTSWIAWGRMTWRFRDVMPATVILSLAFLLGEQISTMSHDAPSEIQAVFAFYYMRGIYAVGFAWVMHRVSALELDSHLEKQRLHLRRRLHDDLGNTLCGLHYNIESLKQADPARVGKALRFLAAGYTRATGTLARILTGLDGPDVNIVVALEKMKRELEEAGWQVDLDISRLGMDISPEVAREIIGILREAASNAVKHSGGSELRIRVESRRHRVRFSISDDGYGFAEETLRQRQRGGAKGILGMNERAELLQGQLEIRSVPGNGTMIMLEAQKSKGRSVIARILNIGDGNQGGFYNTLVRAKQLGTGIQLARTALLPVAVITNPLMLTIILVVVLDTLCWTFFRGQLHRALRRQPWLLIIEALLFSLLFFLTWNQHLPLMIVDTTNLFMVLAAYFLDIRRAFTLSMILAAGIVLASVLAPALPGLQGERNEMVIINIMSNIFFAVAVGFFVKFINELQEMQQDAVARTLARQREQFSAATHRQVHTGIEQLERQVAGLQALMANAEAVPHESIERLRQYSNDTKQRLRGILNFLDQPESSGLAGIVLDDGSLLDDFFVAEAAERAATAASD